MSRYEPDRALSLQNVITPRTMERLGRDLGRPWAWFVRWPFINRVALYPPRESRDMPGPVAEVYQLAVRKTHDHERDYRQEHERLRQEMAADTQTIERAAGLNLPAPSQRVRSIFYVPIMIAFGAAEACVNVIIFLVLAMSQASTYVASLMLAIGLPVLAHFAGKSWKQIETRTQNRVVMRVTVTAAVVVISAIAVVRCAYVSATMQFLLNVHLSPLTVAVVFWAMNLAIFAAATVASHAHTVEDPEGEELGLQVVAAGERRARNQERLRTLQHEFRTLCAQCDTEFKALAAAFFHGNMKARRRIDPEPPVWIQHVPDVPIPPALCQGPGEDNQGVWALVPAAMGPSSSQRAASTTSTWTLGRNGRSRNER